MPPRVNEMLTVVLMVALPLSALGQKDPTLIDVMAKIDSDFRLQGEYAGILKSDGKPQTWGVQVSASRVVAYLGGLPGAGWDGKTKVTGKRSQNKIAWTGPLSSAVIKEGAMTVFDASGDSIGVLKRIVRKSPSEGAKPPKGATILFDGKNDHFDGTRRTKDGYLMGQTRCKLAFKNDFHLHMEFRVPYKLGNNSGIKGIAGFYEIQVLDSFGKESVRKNDCGALYGFKAPDVNMSFPPLSWQTYDVDYQAARFDRDGKLTKKPRITVRHNGVVTHDDIEAHRRVDNGEVRLLIQWHGGIIHWRNIWLAEKTKSKP